MRRFKIHGMRAMSIALLSAVFATVALAQSTTDGAIGGTVFDAQGAVVPNATITVSNNGTGATKSVTTDARGYYHVAQLQPGDYSVSVEANGFSKFQVSHAVVEVGRLTSIEPKLNVGGAAETVNVTDEAPTVNTTSSDFANNMDQAQIDNLPINGRRWSTFALLAPGVTNDGNFGLISFRGISGLLNNNTVDGGDNNQAFFSEERGRTRASYTVSQASIQEFQVNTSNYSAEYGRAAGGVVNSVTKSGTNSLHGEGFYYIRNNALGATNPYTTHYVSNGNGGFNSVPFKPEDNRQQFGGNLGGPIIKDKLFFFFNYDGQRRNFPGVAVPGSPSFLAAPSSSELSTFINNVKNATAVTMTQAQAQAGYAQGLAFLAGETGEVPRTGDQDILFPKIDWKINNSNTASVSYNRMRWNSPAGIQTQPTVTYGKNSFGNDYVKTDMMNARLNTTFSTTMTNELRYQYGRDFEFETSQAPSSVETQAGLDTAYGGRPPYITISGGGMNLGRANFLERTAYPDERRNQVSDTATKVWGNHLLKFGVDFDHNDDLLDNLYTGGGQYSYSNRTNFISDLYLSQNGRTTPCSTATPCNFSSFSQAFGPSAIEFATMDYAGFIQDDWKMAPRFTLNLGVRYEFEHMPSPMYPNPAVPQSTSLNADKNNFGPRVGFAWDIFGDGKTSVRGGYGVYYGRINNGAIEGALFNTGANGTQKTYTGISPTNACAPVFPNVLSGPTCGSAGAAVAFFDKNLQNPQIHEADLMVEREIASNTVISASYLMSLGRELPNFYDTNVAPSTQNVSYVVSGGRYNGQTFAVPFYGTRINPAFGNMIDVVSNVNSSYNALVLQLNRRMTHGLQFMNNYTWSHAIDNDQNSQTQTATFANVYDPYNLSYERGSSNFDVRHKFVSAVVWQPQYFQSSGTVVRALLNGWGLSPIVTLATGHPYTPTISGNAYTWNGTKWTTLFGVGGGINGSGGVFRLAPLEARNDLNYPNTYNVDLRLSRSFAITERQKLEFDAEAFNLFNHEQITGINLGEYTTAAPTGSNPSTPIALNYQPTFGTANQAGAALYRERQVQFALKYQF